MHFNVYAIFYLQFSNQHIRAAIAAIFRWYYHKNTKLQMWLFVSFSLHNYLKIIII
jgi:hypothetical protein